MRRYSSLVLLFVLIATLPGCMRHRSVKVAGPAGGSAEKSNETGSPSALSNFIQATLKISQENTTANQEALNKLHQRRPYLAELATRVARDGKDIDSRRQLADAYAEAGLLPFAFQMFQEIQSINPNDSLASVGIANVWDRWGDYNLAYQHAERAVLLDPKSAEALESLGRVHLHRNQVDQALSAFLSAVEIKPHNASLLANTGYLFLKRGDFLQARLYLERAVAIDGSLVEARNNLGIVLARLGEPDSALREFMAVNDPAVAFNNLGAAYMEQKRWTEARAAFRRALALDPGYKKAQANLNETEARIPRPTIVNLPPFKDSAEVAVTPAKSDSKKAVAVRADKAATVSKRESRISAAYQDALSRFRQKRYREAIDIFHWLLEQYPSDIQASNCQYWIGESYFGLGDYKNAYIAFKRVTSYSGSTKRSDALTMMKRAVTRQRQTGRSKAA